MLSDTTIDIPLVLIISLICAIILCISLPQRPKDHTMPQTRSAVKESAPIQTNTQISNFLVLDVEGTCIPGKGFDWPNEIIVRLSALVLGNTLSCILGMASDTPKMGARHER
jgi:hypothetical protein